MNPWRLNWCSTAIRPIHSFPPLVVHRRCGGEVLAGLLTLARAPIELTEAEVAVGDERAHAKPVGECQGLAEVAGSVLAFAGRRDVTREAERVGLASHPPQPASRASPYPAARRTVESSGYRRPGGAPPATRRSPARPPSKPVRLSSRAFIRARSCSNDVRRMTESNCDR